MKQWGVPLRLLGVAPQWCRWVFHLKLALDVMETFSWDFVGTCEGEVATMSFMASWRRTIEMFCRRSSETLLGVSFQTYPGRHWYAKGDISMRLPRHIFNRYSLCCNPICLFYLYVYVKQSYKNIKHVDHGDWSTKRLKSILAYCLQMKFLVVILCNNIS